jgi:5-hydroxyisourate hydrolase-like protein (transthyretin family)
MFKHIIIFCIFIILFLIFFIFVQSCKKKTDKLTISGYIYDTNESSPAGNVSVSLFAQKITGGSWNANYERINSTTTGSDGKFSFKFDVIKVSGYRLFFEKLNYFTITNDFSGNVVSNGGEYYQSYQIIPVAFLKIHIKNLFPFNLSDYMSYNIVGGTSSGSDCCSDTISRFHGKNIDITRICKIYGNKNIKIEWIYTKNNNSHPLTTNLFCPAFDTTFIDLFY